MQIQSLAKRHLVYAMFLFIAVSMGILVSSEVGHEQLKSSYDDAILGTETSRQLSMLNVFVGQVENAHRGYLLTGRKKYLDSYNNAWPKIAPLFAALREHYDKTESEQLKADFQTVALAVEARLSLLETGSNMAKNGKRELAIDLFQTDIGEDQMVQLRTGVRRLQAVELQRSTMSVKALERKHDMSRLAVAMVTLLNIVLAFFIFRWLRADWEREQKSKQVLNEQREHLDQLVAERTSQLEILASHLQEVSENEKANLARELHDELGAILTASRMDVSWVRQHLTQDQGALTDKLTRALSQLEQGIQAKRRVIENLMPSTLISFGLVVALSELTENMQASAGWMLNLNLPRQDFELTQKASIAMYRIAQESLNNIAKYAQAKTVTVTLRQESEVTFLEIEDDGVGFAARDMRSQSHGLPGMRQRMIGLGGTLLVDSQVGKGTRVRARLPKAVEENRIDPFSD